MTDKEEIPPQATAAERSGGDETAPRFPELDELQREIERRIRDNKRFLDGFMDDDFATEEEGEEESGDEESEEL